MADVTIPVDVTLKNGNPKDDFFGRIPKSFVVTSFGNDLTSLSCESGKLQSKKIDFLQRHYAWICYDKKMEFDTVFSFQAY